MKKLFAAILFVLISPTLHAQVLSAGLRLGPTAFLEVSGRGTVMPFEFQQGAITSELFARYQLKRRWAFEATLSAATRLHTEERVSAIDAAWSTGVEETNTYYYELGLAAQYELTCRHAKKPAKPSRFHYYFGISAGAVLAAGRSEVYADGQPAVSVMSIVVNDFQLWGGFNHTLSYDLSKHLSLMAKADFRVNLNSLTGIGDSSVDNYPDASAGFRLGAAYHIWKKR
jgi:hypothetical protein